MYFRGGIHSLWLGTATTNITTQSTGNQVRVQSNVYETLEDSPYIEIGELGVATSCGDECMNSYFHLDYRRKEHETDSKDSDLSLDIAENKHIYNILGPNHDKVDNTYDTTENVDNKLQQQYEIIGIDGELDMVCDVENIYNHINSTPSKRSKTDNACNMPNNFEKDCTNVRTSQKKEDLEEA